MVDPKHEVALFITCIVDLIRPDVGFAVVKVLEAAGYTIIVPPAQTCCGQPNYNGGDKPGAQAVARANIDMLLEYDHVVVPSGSCAGMIKCDYPRMFSDDPVYRERAQRLAGHVWELASFLVEVAGYHPEPCDIGQVTYHDGCAGLRELGVKSQPRQLLTEAGAEIVESEMAETCCGFGGTFSIKYPEISNNMVQRKVADARASGAPRLVSGDLGCLLNIEGNLHRQGVAMEACHFVELLAKGID